METIFIGVAWPYANGEQHIGHIAGAYLPPDIFARFHRLKGNKVLMASGSDAHGTPITVSADKDGVSPNDIVDRYHPKFIEAYQKLGLTFDIFTHTDTQNHWDVTHDLFLRHMEKGYIYKDKQNQIFDPEADRFLPDRYVEGTCPKCGYEDARGDQCDECGAIYDATELKNPRSKVTGNKNLEVRESEHFFLDLGKLNEPLLEWVSDGKDHWRTNVRNVTKSRLEERNLRGRAITRDMKWGITIPLEGFENKRIYVWYDAVIGYLSASKEWAKLTGDDEAWKEYWDAETHGDTKASYFIGKDNIPFHTMIWPGMLMGYGGLNLPYDVPSNEYLQMKGGKISKSRGTSILISDVLDRYQVDAWRFALTAMAPEGNDVDFTWEDFVERVNGELINNWGNLLNRMLGFAYKRFDGKVPNVEGEDEEGASLVAEIKKGFETVGDLYSRSKFRGAMTELLRLSSLANNYITKTAPFTVIKTDEEAAGRIVYATLQAIDYLAILWSPILPNTSQLVNEALGYEGQLFGEQYIQEVEDERGKHLVLRYDHSNAVGEWKPRTLPKGQAMNKPDRPFQMLDKDKVLEQELSE